jgi:spore germination protein YaaH
MNRLLFSLIIFVSITVFARKESSVHQFENDNYMHSFLLQKEVSSVQTVLNKTVSNQQLSKTVFGYLPDWVYYNNLHANLKYNLLTHIAIFSFSTDSLGNLTNPWGWPWSGVISSARTNNVKIIMCVTAFEGNVIHKLLSDETVKQNLFNNIKSKIAAQSLDGVNIDFENLLDADKSSAINNFMSQLKTFLSAYQSSLEVSFASPIAGFGLWNFSGLANACDYLFVMAYDFYGSWSTTTGPTAPLTGGYYNITKSFNEDYGSVSSNKLILGVPYYGNYWKTKTQSAYSSVDSLNSKKGWQKVLYYNEIIPAYSSRTKMWDNTSQTPWLLWTDTTYKQIWYDNDSSLALKYDFAKNKNLKGVGIWALGYDDGQSELWNLIQRKFTATSLADENKNLPGEFILYQNYPNPFNPSTVISYKLQTSGYTVLKIYDILGCQIAVLVDEFQPSGSYNFQFSILNSQLPTGIYFYTLQCGNFVTTKKMIIIK